MTALQKERILDALYEQWDVLDQLLSSVTGDDWFTPTPFLGGPCTTSPPT